MQTSRILARVKITELLSSFKNYVCIQSPQTTGKPIAAKNIIEVCADTVGTQRFHSMQTFNCLSFPSADEGIWNVSL